MDEEQLRLLDLPSLPAAVKVAALGWPTLLAMNDADIQLQIDLAPTSTNGDDAPAGPFTTVVTNTETPANPRADTTLENYELAFTAQVPFNFRAVA